MRRIAVAALMTATLAVAGVVASQTGQPSAAESAPPPVVLVVLDALPTYLLQDAEGQIDAERFPNFAALARHGSWFPNATTISESTRFSVPAILDGRHPRAKTQPTVEFHPRNLFTLLARRYRMNVNEEATELCPQRLCNRRRPVRGTVVERLRHGRVGRFRRVVAALESRRAQLTFIHLLLPHEPRQYLPSGSRYDRALPSEPDLSPPDTMHRRYLMQHELQRTILQLQYTDKLIGELVARMQQIGIWDRALVAITSDHGESFAVKPTPAGQFRIGELNWQRDATRSNLHDLAGVGFFLKRPGQREGGLDPRFVRTTDLLPTILEAAGVRRPRGLAGRSLLQAGFRGYRSVRVVKQDGRVLSMSASAWSRRARQSVARRIELFGEGTHSVFDFGPRRELLGRAVSELPAAPRSRLRAELFGARDYSRVRPGSGYVPALARGWLRGGRAAGRTLAFALNGRIEATAPSYPALGSRRINFVALLPETTFRPGANDLRVYEVAGDRLRPLTP